MGEWGLDLEPLTWFGLKQHGREARRASDAGAEEPACLE